MKKQKKKRGATSIEIVLSVLLVIIMICGFADLSVILKQSNTASRNTAYISRVVGRQGGVQRSEISNFGGDTYITSNELYQNVKASMNAVGLEDDKWSVKVAGRTLTPTTAIPIVDYGNKLSVSVHITYSWMMTSNFVPGTISGKRESSMSVLSTHTVRNSSYY